MTRATRRDVSPLSRVNYPKNVLTLFVTVLMILVTVPGGEAAGMVMIDGMSYNSLQAAYAVARNGSILTSQGVTTSEGFFLNRDIGITLLGGYDSTFNARNGSLTIIGGPLIVRAGGVVIENLGISGVNAKVFTPNVTGMIQDEAEKLVAAAGLTVGTVTRLESSTIPVGSIISQEPSAGTSVDLTIGVNLVVSTGPPVVTLATSMGMITITLFRDKAPVTVRNFLDYAGTGFYDGLIFHRIIKGFMIQGGGMTYDPYSILVPKATGPAIINEADKTPSNLRGTVAMARTAAPNSATSQFFINTVDNTFLDYKNVDSFGYAVFGQVTGGMDVVDAISNVSVVNYVNSLGQVVYEAVPRTPVTIISVQRVQ